MERPATTGTTHRSPVGPTSATTSPSSPSAISPRAPARETASCSTSPTRSRRSGSTRLSTRASPIGTRRPSTTTAPRSSSLTNGAGGSRPRCRAYDPLTWGADAIYDIVDGKLEFRSYYKLPAPQLEQENCVAHNGSIVPVPGRDIFVQAWYQGGLSVIDFTDSAHPVEIAYFDRGPIDAEELVMGGYWSTYWYHGHIYGTEIARGLDVFALTPSQFLSESEIAAAARADGGGVFNPAAAVPCSVARGAGRGAGLPRSA